VGIRRCPRSCGLKQRRSGERSSQAACFHDAWELLFFLLRGSTRKTDLPVHASAPSPPQRPSPSKIFASEHLECVVCLEVLHLHAHALQQCAWIPSRRNCVFKRDSSRSSRSRCPGSDAVGCFRKRRRRGGRAAACCPNQTAPIGSGLRMRCFNIKRSLPRSPEAVDWKGNG